MTTKPRIALLDYRYRRRDAWYVDLRAAFDAEWIEGPGIAIGESVRDEIDLAIIRDERGGPEASVAVRELVERHVPTLHLAHGIIEWRNTWEFPNPCAGDDPYPPYFQPILCHKMACFGRAQARLLEAWGNGGKCEIVGFPRLDPYLPLRPRTRAEGEERRVLVVTANKPAFTAAQHEKVLESLRDLKAWFEANRSFDKGPVKPVWRLTKGLNGKLGVTNDLGPQLVDVLRTCDAMITTPSTTILEGMLFGLPVATVDYTNSPPYTPTAWNITAPDHVDDVVRGILDPAANRMLHQDMLLHDALECRSPATPRLFELMERMIDIGRRSRRKGKPLEFPRRILPAPSHEEHAREPRMSPAALYPDREYLRTTSIVELQAWIAHLRRLVIRQESTIEEQNQRLREYAREMAGWKLARLGHEVDRLVCNVGCFLRRIVPSTPPDRKPDSTTSPAEPDDTIDRAA